MPRDLRTLIKEMRGPNFDADTDNMTETFNKVSGISYVSGKINAIISGTVIINDRFTKIHSF